MVRNWRAENTPAEIVGRLNKEINSGLADPRFKARLLALGVEPKAMTSDDFSKFVVDETEKWGKVILQANIKAE
jgi:tripartite-type tricarboxylate transporter receptor subunit TctC